MKIPQMSIQSLDLEKTFLNIQTYYIIGKYSKVKKENFMNSD